MELLFVAVVAFINRDLAEIGPRLKQSDVMWRSAGDGLVGRPAEDHILLLSILSAHTHVCVCVRGELFALEDLIIDYDCVFFPPSSRFRFRRRILEPKINVFV